MASNDVTSGMEDLVRSLVKETQVDVLEKLAENIDLLDQEITIDCSTLNNHCVCAANFEYFRKPDHFLQCLVKKKCFHCQRYRYMHRQHETVTASTKLILIAAALGKFQVMKFLSEHGCSLETKSGIFELRPLHLSIVHNHFNIFCYLLAHQADVNSTILSHGTTFSPLMLAVIHQQEDMFRYLLMSKNIDIAYRNSMCQSPVMFAVQNNNIDMMNLLLNAEKQYLAIRGPTKRSRDPVQGTPRLYHPGALLEALRQDNAEVLKVLLEGGCNANFIFRGYYVRTPAILLAAVRNSWRCLELMLQNGADGTVTVDDWTALDWANRLGWQESISILQRADSGSFDMTAIETEEESDSNSQCIQSQEGNHRSNEEECSPAVDREDECSSQLLSPRGTRSKSDTGATNISPLIAIWRLCQWIDVEVAIRQLVSRGEMVNVQDPVGRTCLHLAVEEQSIPGVRTLLQLGADTEIQDDCQATPFWHAVYWNKESMVKELLFANVCVTTAARENAYKLDLPWKSVPNHRHCNRISIDNAAIRSPLYIATQKNFHVIVHLLLESGYDTNGEDIEHLLHIAKQESRDLLIDHQQNAKGLATITRNFIRKQCGLKIHKLVESMDIPFRLKDLLLLRDIMDLRIEPVFVHL